MLDFLAVDDHSGRLVPVTNPPGTEPTSKCGGGNRFQKTVPWRMISPHVAPNIAGRYPDDASFAITKYAPLVAAELAVEDTPDCVVADIPLSHLVDHLTVAEMRIAANIHLVTHKPRARDDLAAVLKAHACVACERYVTVVVPNVRPSRGRAQALPPRQEYLEDALPGIKPLSLEELASCMRIPENVLEHYQLGAKVCGLQLMMTDDDSREPPGASYALVVPTVPWLLLARKGTRKFVQAVAQIHGLSLPLRMSKSDALDELSSHGCSDCPAYEMTVRPVQEKSVPSAPLAVDLEPPSLTEPPHFPPEPLPFKEETELVREFCHDMRPHCFEEAGCAVCGQLTLKSKLQPLSSCNFSLQPLVEPGLVRLERRRPSEGVQYDNGPVLEKTLTDVCDRCVVDLEKGRRPLAALANGFWVGPVPDELANLTFVEQLLVARVRTNRCVVRVSCGQSKMMANAISFASPMVKVYHHLPPPRDDLEEGLAFLFTGISPPTDEDLKRTPMLVRRNVVKRALDWLKLNHADYSDLQIDYSALNSYPEEGIPLHIKKCIVEDATNIVAAATSVHDTEEEQGATAGECPFSVCGLIGSSLEGMSMATRKAIALHHLRTGGSVLAIGHQEKPESMYDNPQLYPQIFPWLFPYGAGGMGNARVKGLMTDTNQKKKQLMYFDKRFQTDSRFVIIAFNQEQIKLGATGSMILTKRSNFSALVAKVLRINPAVIANIAHRLQDGERVTPQTEEEKACFTLMDQIDYVCGQVHGSTAAKKMRRNELWSLITNRGAPSWFVTLSPADSKHPLCIYWADKEESFTPDLKHCNERARLIASNPVAGARFFNYMVQLFIKHLLRWSDPDGRRGVFGHTGAYYGTVEQQGRMTLHLHILIWITCALSPQEVRDRLLSKDSEFTAELIAYLEDCQTGEFLTGTMEDMVQTFGALKKDARRSNVHRNSNSETERHDVDDPTLRLPVCPPPPSLCGDAKCTCSSCSASRQWELSYKETIDNVIYRSNVHTCYVRKDVVANGVHKKHVTGKGCINKDGVCTARFPRKIYEESSVSEDGHLNLKKLESQINTINRTMAYCYCCNTDCTCLSSGTAVKATVGYIADYIVKMGLKTYQIFSSIYDVFERNPDILAESKTESDAARRLILKMANSLTSKVEVGGPMAAMYLLGHPDHYSSHTFAPLYWKQYVTYVLSVWSKMQDLFGDDDGGQPHAHEPAATTTLNLDESCHDTASDPDRTLPACSMSSDMDPVDSDVSEEDNVRVTRSYGRLMSRSHVDDYRLRPAELESVCLYEWIQCSIRKPLTTRKKIPAGHLSYLPTHPLVETHSIVWDINRTSTVVPNILGPFMPRPDEDDRDFYAATMLTLFAPWRTGFDLKSTAESWTTAFDRYTFANRHSDIIHNMNIRYECYDARDDYHAQLSKQVAAQNVEELENDSDDEGGYDAVDLPVDFTDAGVVGPWSQSKIKQMQELEVVLQSAGWVVDGSSYRTGTQSALQPDRALTATRWKDLVAVERRRVLAERSGPALKSSSKHLEDDMDIWYTVHTDARIVPGAYFLESFRLAPGTDSDFLSRTITEFSLNTEQLRAFNIVAHHSLSVGADPLNMYVGGMAGTGKTRVIDALRRWFDLRGEPHRMVVLAPTGAAASVVSGSTYHSFLGVATGERRNHTSNNTNALEEARIRMMNVDYVFLDEISMVSCQDLYLIDARLKSITKMDDLPFGGVNIIVAGDFAQLPPAKGCALYSGEVSKVQLPRQIQSDQENTLGMLLWHHFVTVVILRENMRQSESSPEDDALRTCLANMRYKACTKNDLDFLRTLIPSSNPSLSLADPKWRDVSVITAWNTHKDQINEMNAKRFAHENKVPLSYFYSIDKQSKQAATPRRSRNSGRAPANPPSPPKLRLTREVQDALWRSQPHTSEHIAGKLPLCVGMPVMIRNNDATELNVTKGQEAVVRGWVSRAVPSAPDKQALEVLFVELLGPVVKKNPVNIPNLPQNTVPLTKISTSIKAVLPDDTFISVARHQVPVLLNFSMTDYASQGKTRDVNVVDVRRSRNHQAMYTALSRGKSAHATLILRDFNDAKVTGGLSGYLREEFRALELLDEITQRRYLGEVPGDVIKQLRASTIISYRAWKKSISLLTSPGEIPGRPKRARDDPEASPPPKRARQIDRTLETAVDASGQATLPTSTNCMSHKRSREDAPEHPSRPIKQARIDVSPTRTPWLESWKWDSTNWSCAFDSVLTVLRFVWYGSFRSAPSSPEYGGYLRMVFDSFSEVDRGDISLELCRFRLRERCWALDRDCFPKGPRGSDLLSLMHVLCGYRTAAGVDATSTLTCDTCASKQSSGMFECIGRYTVLRTDHSAGLDKSVEGDLRSLELPCGYCGSCGGTLHMDNEYPPMINVQLSEQSTGEESVACSVSLSVALADHLYRLAAVIYWGRGDEHFSVRIRDDSGVWYAYDGMVNGGNVCVDQQLSIDLTVQDLAYMGLRKATIATYVRVDE